MTILDPITQSALAIHRNIDAQGLTAKASKVIPVSFGHRVVEGFTIWASQNTSPALAAMSDLLSFTDGANVEDGDTVTIGTKVYTFQATLTNVDGHVHIGTNVSESLINLRNAINNTGGSPGTDYATATVANSDVVAADNAGSMEVDAKPTAAPSVATSTTSSHLKWENGSLVANNTVAGVPVQQTNAPPILAGATRATFAVSLGYSLVPAADRSGTQVLRIWADDQLIWDASNPNVAPTFTDMTFTFHPGLENAEPDATIVADMGDLTPGFRNLIYLVIRDFNLQVGPTPEAPPPTITAPQPVVTTQTFPYPGIAPDPNTNAYNAGIYFTGPGLGIGPLFLTNPPNIAFPVNGFNGRFIAWINDSQSRTGVGGGYDSIAGTVTPYPVKIGDNPLTQVVAGNDAVDATVSTTTIKPGTVTQAPPPEPTYRTTLPKIRVELADAIPTTPTVSNFDAIPGNFPNQPQGVFADWDRGIAYGFTQNRPGTVDTYNFVEHEYSLSGDNIELFQHDPQGTFTCNPGTPEAFVHPGAQVFFVNFAAHDKVNNLCFTQSTIANSVIIEQIDLSSGKIVGTYGLEGGTLNDVDGVTIGMRNAGDCVVSQTPDGRTYGLVSGSFLTGTVGYQSYAVDGGLGLSSSIVLNPPTVFGFYNAVNSVLAIPILDRKDLEARFNVSTTTRQDWFALAALGQLIYLLRGTDSTITSADLIYTTDYPVHFSFWDVNDNSAILIKDGTASANQIEKLTFNYGLGDGGIVPVFAGSAYNKTLPDSLPVSLETSLRESIFDAGQFVYPAGNVSDGFTWITIDLGSGDFIGTVPQPHVGGQTVGAGWLYNAHTGAVTVVGNGTAAAAGLNINFGVGGAIQLSDVLTWLMLNAGYEAGNISVAGTITDQVQGGIIDSRVGLWSYLTNLGVVYQFDYFESEGKIKFNRGTSGDTAGAAYSIDVNSLGEAQGGEGDLHENVITTLAAPIEMASAVEVGYVDVEFDYQKNARTFQRARFPFRLQKPANTASYETYMVMTGSEALQRAAQASFVNYAESVVQNLALPFQFAKLEPADTLNVLIDNTEYLITIKEVVFNTDWSLSVTGTNFNYRNNVVVSSDRPIGLINQSTGPSDSLPLVLDVPLPAPSDDPGLNECIVFTGVESFGQQWWTGATMNILTPDLGAWAKAYFTSTQANYARCPDPLPATDTPFRTDTTTVFEVVGVSLTGSGAASITNDQFWQGVNAAWVGKPGRWELIYFENTNWVNSRRLQISTILRGRRGTEINCNNHESGDLFVPFDRTKITPYHLAVSYLGDDVSWSAVGQGTTKAAAVETDTLAGNSLKPWAITYVKAVRL